MDGFGGRLRARSRALGVADAEVARRLGVSASRYANYVNGTREPDFATLLRLCEALATTPAALLGVAEGEAARPGVAELRRRVAEAAAAMDRDTLQLAAEVVEALARGAPGRRG